MNGRYSRGAVLSSPDPDRRAAMLEHNAVALDKELAEIRRDARRLLARMPGTAEHRADVGAQREAVAFVGLLRKISRKIR